ncbi:hypothetical protein BH10PSE17_BH10PSE17_17500 [soil metagenome]
MKLRSIIAIALLTGSGIGAAHAADTYKCDVGGRITYTDQPCTSGKQSRVAGPSFETSAASRAEALDRNAEQARRADEAVAAVRLRADEDAKRRTALAIADRNAETERLRREAAEAEHTQLIYGPRNRPYRPPLIQPRRAQGFTARGDEGGSSVTIGR